MSRLTRWTETKEQIKSLPENNPFKESFIALYELIRYVYDSIPEVE